MSAGLPDWWTLGLAEVWHVHASWVDPSATRVAPGVHDYAQCTRARGLPPGEGSARRWPVASPEVSGQAILEGLICAERLPALLAELARRWMGSKILGLTETSLPTSANTTVARPSDIST